MNDAMERRDLRLRRGILRVVLVYAVFAAAWIIFSDMLVVALWHTPETVALVGTLKGWAFVALTSLLLYVLLRRLARPSDAETREEALPPVSLVNWPRWTLYAFALVASLVTLALRLQLQIPYGERPLLIVLLFPVILSASLGGLGPGLLATAVVALGIQQFAMPDFAAMLPQDLLHWGFLIVEGGLISLLAELMRQAWRQTAGLMQERLRQLGLLEAIADNSGDAIYAKDLAGRFLLFNRVAARITGQSAEAVLGRDDRALFPAEQAERLMAVDRRVMASGQVETHEETLDTALGRRVFLATKGPLRDGDGRIFGLFGVSRDITEGKRAEEALRQSESRFRALVEQSLAGIYIIQDGRFRYVNMGFAAIFGYAAPADIVERLPVEALVDPADRARVADNIRRRVEGDIGDIHYSFTGLRRDGGRITVEVHGRVFDYEDAPAVIGLILDITARKAAEDALRASELRFHDIVNASADWVWEVDAEGRFTYASDSVQDLLGYTPGEILGKTPFDLMPPEEAERVRGVFRDIAGRREPFRDLDNINVRKDGQRLHISTNGMPILDAAGRLLGYRGLDRDISERKAAELELRQSEARFRTLFDNAAVAIIVHDPEDGAILDANRRALEVFGCDSLDELRRNDFWLDPPYSRQDALRNIRQVAREGSRRFEWLIRDRRGRESWQEVLLDRITLNGRERVLAIGTDITARKAAEAALHRQAEEMRRRNDELERFNRASVGRELDMIAVKRRANDLARRLGEPPPYALGFLEEAGAAQPEGACMRAPDRPHA